MAGNSAIESLIRREIQSHGPISFARFMELALYCPNIGYYERAEDPVGRRGDYYTSVSAGPLFGELLGFAFGFWLERLPGPIQLVEAGAHDGQLANDILSCLRTHHAPVFDRLQYWMIEPSLNRQKPQERTLNDFAGKVRWFTAFPGEVTGIIFSNELLDAFPFQRFGWNAKSQTWFEWRVDENFNWVRGDSVEPPAGFDIPRELEAVLPDGFTLEASSAAADWWRTAARSLRGGRLVAIDYMLTADELLRPERIHGTARAYRAHHVTHDLLANPGEQDITAHVNVTRLQGIGEAEGLTTEGLLTQAAFLTRIVREGERPREPHSKQFQTLTHPEHLGEKFKVFIQRRDHGPSGI